MTGKYPVLSRRTLLTGVLGGAAALALTACQDAGPAGAPAQSTPESPTGLAQTPPASASTAPSPPRPATPAEITARANVPVLCWHQIREWTASDDSYSRSLLICPPANFRAQLEALARDGWSTIGPDQYLAHLTENAPLPAKPVLLSFDDSQGSQMTEALPQLLDRGMTATFFAMTVVLDKPGWLASRDLKELDARGMTIGAHTWDHHRLDRYTDRDWKEQLDRPRERLEKIVGKPVDHFAYPYGAWNQAALTRLVEAGYRSAYQLTDAPDPAKPLYTLRRSLVNSTWTGPQLLQHLTDHPTDS